MQKTSREKFLQRAQPGQRDSVAGAGKTTEEPWLAIPVTHENLLNTEILIKITFLNFKSGY